MFVKVCLLCNETDSLKNSENLMINRIYLLQNCLLENPQNLFPLQETVLEVFN